jgi:N-acetylglucosaminyl-diphospho-decaprenol L-rhamnosyltransferase
MDPSVSVLIVAYQCRDAVRDCIASVPTGARTTPYEVIVVDNASSDGTAQMIADEFPSVLLEVNAANLGFARGVNVAARRASGEFLLLLNPDMVVHESSIDAIVAFARSEPGFGVYGGRTVRPEGGLEPSSCWGLPSLWSLFCFATMLSTVFKRSRLFDPESLGKWNRDTVREVGMVTGCLLLIGRERWMELGGFDERFFMYGEDADLAYRARARGLRPVVVPTAVATHKVGASSRVRADKLILLLRGKTTLLRKHWRRGPREVGLALIWLGVAVRASLGSLWRPAWRARSTWIGGYVAATEPEVRGS